MRCFCGAPGNNAQKRRFKSRATKSVTKGFVFLCDEHINLTTHWEEKRYFFKKKSKRR